MARRPSWIGLMGAAIFVDVRGLLGNGGHLVVMVAFCGGGHVGVMAAWCGGGHLGFMAALNLLVHLWSIHIWVIYKFIFTVCWVYMCLMCPYTHPGVWSSI